MRKLIDIELSEKEWKHVKHCYREFNKEENRNCESCPMGWISETNVLYPSKINKKIENKIDSLEKELADKCMCHQFPEFARARREEYCPCNVYSKDQAFRQLAKLIKRWEKEDGNSG